MVGESSVREEGSENSQTALDFLKRCSKNALLWRQLINHEEVVKQVAGLLVAQVRDGDGALAQLLVQIKAGLTADRKKKAKRKAHPEPAWPPRSRRRLYFKQGPNSIWTTKGIACLNQNLMAVILSAVDLSTKLSALCVSRGLREVLQCRTAWDPLVVNQVQCRSMLRSMREKYFTRRPTSGSIPEAIYKVAALHLHLMQPERAVRDQSDTEDEERRPIPMIIVSPMRELSRGWPSFDKLSQLTLQNIDALSVSYDFLNFRCVSLQSFGFVKLHFTGNKTYALEAAKREPLLVDCADVASMNLRRIPASVRRHSATTISEREALFLLEHQTAYKNGSDIRFMHEINLLNSHLVRKQYKRLVECLKEKYPSSFQ